MNRVNRVSSRNFDNWKSGGRNMLHFGCLPIFRAWEGVKESAEICDGRDGVGDLKPHLALGNLGDAETCGVLCRLSRSPPRPDPPRVSRCGFSPWRAVLALYSLPHAMTKTAHVRRSFQRWGSSAERPQAMRRAIPFRAAHLNADVGSTCETNEVGCDGLPPSSGETSGCLSGDAACRVAGGRRQPGWYREGLSLVLGSEGERESARLPGRDGKPFFIGGALFGPGGALDTRGEGDYGDHGRARATA